MADKPEADDPLAAYVSEDGIDLNPTISVERLGEIKAEAIAKVRAEALEAAEKKALKEEIARLRNNIDPNGARNDQVYITMDLAEHSAFVSLDNVRYYHAQTYLVPRHKADTLREIAARGWKHQDEIDGKNLIQHYQNKRQPVLSGKVAA